MKAIRLLIIALVLTSLSQPGLAQQETDTLHVLFVDNSYTFTANMTHLVSLIADSTDTKLITYKSTAGGASLRDHWLGEKGLNTKAIISDGNYDIVVLQEHSMGTIQKPDDFFNYSGKFAELIKASGAQPYLYMTWARERVPQYQQIITSAYRQAAKQHGFGVVPVGEAWQAARELQPKIPLFMADGSHPSGIGALLTAAVFVSTLSADLPDQIPNYNFILDDRGEKVLIYWENPEDIVFSLKVAAEFLPK